MLYCIKTLPYFKPCQTSKRLLVLSPDGFKKAIENVKSLHTGTMETLLKQQPSLH